MARSVAIEWSDEALADLQRFADFLHSHQLSLANIVAHEIIEKTQVPRTPGGQTDQPKRRNSAKLPL
jgi:hypothetical protein